MRASHRHALELVELDNAAKPSRSTALIAANGVSKTFRTVSGARVRALQSINLTIMEAISFALSVRRDAARARF